MYEIGCLYEEDRVSQSGQILIRKDAEVAFLWYQKAAVEMSAYALNALVTRAQSDGRAALIMAQLYENGQAGLAKNIERAIYYYDQASKLGNATASEVLGRLYASGYPGSQLLSVPAAELAQAAKGKTKATEVLSIGAPIAPDLNLAVGYYLAAMRQGSQDALAELTLLFPNIRVTQLQQNIINTCFELGYRKKAVDLYLKVFAIEAAVTEVGAVDIEQRFKIQKVNPQLLCVIADFYLQQDANTSIAANNVVLAVMYYAAALPAEQAVTSLLALADKGEAVAQFILATDYYHKKGNFAEAVKWCLMAAEQGYSKAVQYLENTSLPDAIYVVIARAYAEGSSTVAQNFARAIYFYQKANQHDGEVLFQLGKLFLLHKEANIGDTVNIAWRYFVQAAQLGNSAALERLEQLVANFYGAEEQLQLAELYGKKFNQLEKAAYWYNQVLLSDVGKFRNVQDAAIHELERLAAMSPNVAFSLAQLYEHGTIAAVPTDAKKAYLYYIQAALQAHVEAKSYLEKLIASGDADVQYLFGIEYLLKKGSLVEAVKLCVKAEMQGHAAALAYLTNTKFTVDVCLQIAEQYALDSENLSRSMPRAVEFYLRASELGSKEATMKLAELYEFGSVGILIDLNKAFDYYMKAAKMGQRDALAPLERLGEGMSVERQMELSSAYGRFFGDQDAASYWREIASEAAGNIEIVLQ